jgi:hypothetical protein
MNSDTLPIIISLVDSYTRSVTSQVSKHWLKVSLDATNKIHSIESPDIDFCLANGLYHNLAIKPPAYNDVLRNTTAIGMSGCLQTVKTAAVISPYQGVIVWRV